MAGDGQPFSLNELFQLVEPVDLAHERSQQRELVLVELKFRRDSTP